jgi:uncharacterized protein (TIGR02145 family)
MANEGWHVSTKTDWDTLQNYLIANGYNWDGTTSGNKIAKALAAKIGWITDSPPYGPLTPGAVGNDLTKNNRSGFSFLTGGTGFQNNIAVRGFVSGYWTVSEVTLNDVSIWGLQSDLEYLGNYSFTKVSGLGVRLVRD